MSSILSGFITTSVKDAFGSLWGEVFGKATDSVLVLLDMLFGGVNSAFVNAFQNPIVQAVMTILGMINWVVFTVSLIFYFLQIAREKQRDWATIVNSFFASVAFVALNQIFCEVFFVLPSMVVSVFRFQDAAGSGSIIESLEKLQFQAIFIIIMIISILYFFYVSIKRFGQMFLQMLIAPFYVPSFLLGDQQLTKDWFKSTIACGFTYVIQYIVFYLGYVMLYFSGGDLLIAIIGVSLLFATFSAPSALQRFSNISPSGKNIMQTIYTANTVFSAGMKIIGGIGK